MRRRWVIVVAAVLCLLAVGLAAAVLFQDDESARTPDGPSDPELQEAVDLADVQADGLEDQDVARMILALCDRDPEAVAEGVLDVGVRDQQQILVVVEDLGVGAARYCPEVAASDPQLINDAYNLALERAAADGE